MKKAEAKWTMPGTFKWPESVQDCACLPLFHARGDDQFQWRFEIYLRKNILSTSEPHPDELRVKLCLATSPRIFAKFSIYVNDDQEDQVVFQHIGNYKCVGGISPFSNCDLIDNLEFGKPGQLIKLSHVSVRCIVEYFKDFQVYKRMAMLKESKLQDKLLNSLSSR